MNAPSTLTKVSQAACASMILMSCRGDLLQAEQAARTFPHAPEIEAYFKSAVSAGTTSDPNWASGLTVHAAVVDGFVGALRQATVLGKLRGLRRVPFNVRALVQTTGSEARFVDEGQPAPVAALGFAAVQLAWAKLQTILVFTSELTRFWSAASESQVGGDMVDGVGSGMDKAFLGDPAAIPAGFAPASILHHVAPVRASSGSSVAAITDDVKVLLATQINAGNDLSNSVIVMSPRSALHISTLRDSSGQLAFPTMNVVGTGAMFGLPVLVSGGVALAGSPTDSYIAVLNPKRILIADDGLATLDYSRHAAVQLNDQPSSGGQALSDLWSQGLVGLKISRYVNWARADDSAVSWLSDVQY